MKTDVRACWIYRVLCFKNMKLTKRRAFNFLRSYFDVLNNIPEDKDKLTFLMSIINKQFLDENPKDLEFIPNLCYESQRHAIEKSVKGWKLANKTDMIGNPMSDPMPPLGGSIGSDPKEEKEKEKEKEKHNNIQVQKNDFIKIWNEVRQKVLKKPSHLNRLSFDQLELLNGINEIDLRNALIGFFKQKIFPNGQDYTTNTKHFLNHFDNYLQAYHDKKDNIYGKSEL